MNTSSVNTVMNKGIIGVSYLLVIQPPQLWTTCELYTRFKKQEVNKQSLLIL